jgi:membrane protein DedA with SNARE-associated domain
VTDFILALLPIYGAAALFGILLVSAIGVPGPASLLLMVVGSLVAQGDMIRWQVWVAGISGAVIGDQIGFFAGRLGGRVLQHRVTKIVGHAGIERAEAFTRRWGGAAIFFSRWLVNPLGPWVNLSSGVAEYPWGWFLLWDVLGEIVWVVLFTSLGAIFSDRVQSLTDLLGELTWVIVGVFAVIIIGWKLFGHKIRPLLAAI